MPCVSNFPLNVLVLNGCKANYRFMAMTNVEKIWQESKPAHTKIRLYLLVADESKF